MKLDQDIRRMATELQNSLLLARISSGDLVATEAKYHLNCLSALKINIRVHSEPKRALVTARKRK